MSMYQRRKHGDHLFSEETKGGRQDEAVKEEAQEVEPTQCRRTQTGLTLDRHPGLCRHLDSSCSCF